MTSPLNPDLPTFNLKQLQAEIGYSFQNPKLLLEAITHSTYAYEQRQPDCLDNERLEFLGDAVLDLVVSHLLYQNAAQFSEGQMTKTRALVVCEPTLAKAAIAMNLGSYLRLGRGEAVTGGRKKASNLSNAVEAIIGATFQDGGYQAAEALVGRLLAADLKKAIAGKLVYDFKSRLIELIQSTRPQAVLKFVIVREEGPVHERTFTAQVLLDERALGEGSGNSKKEAEQQAAQEALLRME